MTNQNDQDKVNDQSKTLKAFSRALNREAHVLTSQPDLLWQQLYNRLQWEGEEVEARLVPEWEQRSRPLVTPWIRSATAFRESAALVRTLTGHTQRVTSCAFSPDGRRIVSACWDNTLKVWDAYNGAVVQTLTGHQNWIRDCAYSPDGRWIVSASDDGLLKVWDAESGAELHTLTGHTQPVASCAFSPDGRWIVSASGSYSGGIYLGDIPGSTFIVNGTLKVWDAHSGAELRSLNDKGFGPVNHCALSPDGQRMVTASRDNTELRVWNVDSGLVLRTLTGHTGQVQGCAFSPDGQRIVTASYDRTLKVWDIESGAELHTLTGHAGQVSGCAFSPDGCWIVSCSADKSLKVWNADGGTEIYTLTGHTQWVASCAFSPDGSLIVSAGGDDMTLRVWNAHALTEGSTSSVDQCLSTGHTRQAVCCGFRPDGRRIVSASWDKTLKVWDMDSGTELRTLTGHTGEVSGCAYSPDGRWIVSASNDDKLKVWDADTGAVLRTLTGHFGSVYSCAFSPDGRRIASASSDHTVRVWDADSGVCLRTNSSRPLNQMISARGEAIRDFQSDYVSAYGCAFSPDGRRIVSANDDNTLMLWDADSRAVLRMNSNRPLNPQIGQLWDVNSSAVLRTLTGHAGQVLGCAFSPDGRRIVSASVDSTLKEWDTESGACLRTLTGHSAAVRGCSFSPDGRWIVSASIDQTLRVWDVDNGRTLAQVEFPGVIEFATWHPWRPWVACSDAGGSLLRIEVVGIELGPIVVTATFDNREITVQCPACQHRFPIQKGSLGGETSCPQAGCSTRLRINPFVIQNSSPAVHQPAPVIEQSVPRKKNWLDRLLKK